MKHAARRNGRLPPRQLLPAAILAVCILAIGVSAAGAQLPAAQQTSPAPPSGMPTTRPAARATNNVAMASAPHPSATQPAVARPENAEGAMRRDAPRDDGPRSNSSAAPAAAATPPGLNLSRLFGALTLVLGLIFALRWVLRRAARPGFLPGATNTVQVLTRSPLSPRQQLLLVRVGRRLLVVADCNGQLNSLSEITDADEVAALVGQLRDEKLSSASKSFGNLLGMWRRGGEAAADEEDVPADGEEFPRAAPDVPARRNSSDAGDDEGGDDPAVASARGEINGLMERVRLISHQFKR